ncbi:MAG: hypothetical protein R3346_03915 [Candidatus Spechtbacterales bacterium]|nr:hypothetical protein [Candidatus Spechtbacterales bacterium]
MDLPTWVWVLIALTWLPAGALVFRLANFLEEYESGIVPKRKSSKSIFWTHVFGGYISVAYWLIIGIIFVFMMGYFYIQELLCKLGDFND